MRRLCGFAVIWMLCAAPLATADELAAALQPLIDAHQGDVAVAIKDLKTGATFKHQADKPMPTASLIKFPLMIAAYQQIKEGKLDPEQVLTFEAEDKVVGSGILTPHFSPGTKITLRDAIHLMIVYSDNSATNMVAEEVGLQETADLMEKFGFPETKLNQLVARRDTSIFPERSKKYALGSTTPADMIELLERLQKRELVDNEASEKMLAHMYQCDDRTKIRRYLRNAKIAHKTGMVTEVRTDAGLIDGPNGPIAICVLTNNNKDTSWGDENAAEILCGRIAQIAFRHFSAGAEADGEVESGVLRIGSAGPLVSSLQRTLNARSKPSPELDDDGDFGGMTEAAVIAFQKANKLEPTGVVGPETWEVLGTLVEAGQSNATAASAAVKPKKPADSAEGAPYVSCKVWAIGNGRTGEIIAGSREDAPVDIASTTKMMTAYLILKYAEEHPEVLEEKITFSKRADDTIGSSAEVRAGETLTVGDLLYGLMLPSGNDASVALGEHFGSRFGPAGAEGEQSENSPKKSYGLFVDAMNAAAKELGMQQTHFDNTHGLTAKSHKASAKDLVTLAVAARKLPLFKKIVSTPQYASTVVGPSGYKRNVVWKNTNQLLEIEGYDGVKTGTTTAAGACLVASASRGDDSLVVVVLGAPSSDSRYVDARNLFRWGWAQLQTEEAGGK